jgi:hypothetical protein
MRIWRSILRLRVLAALPALALATPTLAAPPPGVTVQHAWVRYLLPNIPAGGYLTLTNTSDYTAVLTGASSPACGSLMLHESMNMGGAAMMMAVQSVPVPAHGSLVLTEGGYHLMCMSPEMKIGGKAPITLQFQDGSLILVQAPVYGPAGAP